MIVTKTNNYKRKIFNLIGVYVVLSQ